MAAARASAPSPSHWRIAERPTNNMKTSASSEIVELGVEIKLISLERASTVIESSDFDGPTGAAAAAATPKAGIAGGPQPNMLEPTPVPKHAGAAPKPGAAPPKPEGSGAAPPKPPPGKGLSGGGRLP
jgi:hypothetical protein